MHIFAQHGARGDIDEVVTRNFGHEGERARCTHVAFDDLYGVIFCDELDVERSRDVERFDNAFRDDFRATDGFEVGALRRQDDCGVARVRAGVLDMFGDGVDDEFAFLRDAVYLDLSRILY